MVGNVGRGITSPPLDSTHGRQRRAWHDITALGQHTQSVTSGKACHHRLWAVHMIERRRALACHHRLWEEQMVERRRAWHPIIAFGLAHTVGRRRAWHTIISL